MARATTKTPALRRSGQLARTTTAKPVGQRSAHAPEQPTLMKVDRPGEPTRPTEHNGLEVAREELIMHLPKAPLKISRLHLEDGSIAYACRDCLFTDDSRGHVMQHRWEEHGAGLGKRAPKLIWERKSTPDLVLEPREDGSPPPTDPSKLTMGEIMALMPSIVAFGDLIDHAERERDAALAMLGEHRANQYKIDNYDRISEELTEVRQQMRNSGSYEELKAEVLKLRAWKRKMTVKLSGLGFHLTEEDQ